MGHMVPMNQEMNMNSMIEFFLEKKIKLNFLDEMIDSMKNSPMQNMQVNRHPNEEHNVGNQMSDLNYAGFNDPSLFQ